jgi:hypothetical protein
LPGRYRRPQFRFSTVRAAGGELFAIIREFADDPHLSMPWGTLSPGLDVRVEVREYGEEQVQESVRVPQRSMFTE